MTTQVEAKTKESYQPAITERKYIAEFPIKDLGLYPYNPDDRINGVRDNGLRMSVKKRGIIHPLTVVPTPKQFASQVKEQFMVIDGHKRLGAARAARFNAVPVMLYHLNPNFDTEQMFNVVNDLARKLTAFESLQTYLKGKLGRYAISAGFRTEIERVSRIAGTAYLHRLLEARISPSSVNRRYDHFRLILRDDTIAFAKAFFNYFAKYPRVLSTVLANRVKFGEVSRVKVINAIRKGEPIKD